MIFSFLNLSGFTLEEVAEILSSSFGIRKSRRRKRRQALKQLSEDERKRREEALMEKV